MANFLGNARAKRKIATSKTIINMFKNFLLVGFGGAVGSMLRYGVTLLSTTLALSSSIGTMFVNVVGSFIIGLIIGSCSKESLYLLLAVGFCGGFTTFSTFSSQAITLLQAGKICAGLLYILTTLIFCIVFVWLGMFLGAKIFK